MIMVNEKICTFQIQGEYFGVDVTKTVETLNHVHLFKVPDLPNLYTGLLNVRGAVIPVMSLNKKLGASEKVVILKHEENKLAISVNSFGDVITLDTQEIESFMGDNNNNENDLNFIYGMVKLNDGKILKLLNIEKIFNF